jgi:hypothetical protein
MNKAKPYPVRYEAVNVMLLTESLRSIRQCKS